eukprot:m.706084 g.706084  ORF g.706084 m.706084 type:complete len:56 (-) comp22931_c0_seq18:2834-3001(-)
MAMLQYVTEQSAESVKMFADPSHISEHPCKDALASHLSQKAETVFRDGETQTMFH